MIALPTPRTPHLSIPRALLPLACCGALAVAAMSALAEDASDDADKIAFFERKVRPVLVRSCYGCHSAETKPAGDLRVDDLKGLLEGGNGGAAVVPGKPDEGTLLARIRHEDPKRKMPKEGDLLTDSEVADLVAWIRDGAAWPRERVPTYLTRVRSDYVELRDKHWAWQPLKQPDVPATPNTVWPWTDLDRFVLAKLRENKLQPVADADPVTLLRRVTFDLTGLPPTPAEIDAFRKDPSREAYAGIVERLLASPAYAERWGRYWLDLARYGESTGPSRNIPYPHAWKYRDYVIDAVARDVPYDRFLQEQLAGDLLPAENAAERDRLLTATGFLALGVKDVNQRFKVRFVMDNVDEQIDVVTRSVLALTVSCARCHDHKFDPISATDYHALAGIFASTENAAGVRNKMGGGGLDYYDPEMLVRLDTSHVEPPPKAEVDALQAKVEEAKKAWDAIRGTPEGLAPGTNGVPKQRAFRVKYESLRADLLALTDPVNRGYAVHGVRDAKTVGDTEIRIRGEAERLGPTVPRGYLSTFEVPGAPPLNRNQSGRLELASWLTSTNNPLTARVMVNRIWQNLFGEGIVNTTDNFGVKGDRPSHPELLDHLARQFMRDGWSQKKLIRSLVLSRTYALGYDAPSGYREIDPGNRLLWRHSPRRLTAEEFRDAILAVAGTLETTPPRGSPVRDLKMIEMADTGTEARKIRDQADRDRVRSVFLPVIRGVTPRTLEPFDPVDQTLVSSRREATTVPTQALYLLNSSFVRRQSLALAERLLSEGEGEWMTPRVERAYTLAFGRNPSPFELERAVRFLAQYEISYAQPPSNDPAFEPPARAAIEAKPPSTAPETVPVNPDDMPRPVEREQVELIPAPNPRTAAWAAFAQSLFASAEFRFVR